MSILDTIAKAVAPLRSRVVNMIARALVNSIDDSKKMQLVQLEVLNGEVRDGVERFQNYGFTSVPKKGAEAIVVRIAGGGDHSVVLCIDDRNYRVGNLESGEVAVYDSTGSTIVLKKNGDIEVTPSSGKGKLTGDFEITGDLKIDGDTNCDGTVTGTTDCVGGGKSLKDHTHLMSTTDPLMVTTTNAVVGSPSTATSATPSGPGSISGSTAKPT